jgi:hypothetical protein
VKKINFLDIDERINKQIIVFSLFDFWNEIYEQMHRQTLLSFFLSFFFSKNLKWLYVLSRASNLDFDSGFGQIGLNRIGSNNRSG